MACHEAVSTPIDLCIAHLPAISPSVSPLDEVIGLYEEPAFLWENRAAEMNDDTWSYMLLLWDSRDLVRLRVLSSYHLALIDKEIDKRRKFGNVRLTMTQFAAHSDIVTTEKRITRLHPSCAGFGVKVLALACATQFEYFSLYIDKEVLKVYSRHLGEMGLIEANKKVRTFQLVANSLPIWITSETVTPKLGRHCLVVDTPKSHTNPNHITGTYGRIIHIVRDSSLTPDDTVHIPRRHSFTLIPAACWEIQPLRSEDQFLATIQQLIAEYRKLLVISDSPEVLAMKAPVGCTREPHYRYLSKDKKNRQLCISRVKQKRLERLEADAIVVQSSASWQHKDILSIVNHIDSVRSAFHLYVFCSHPSSVLWEYAQIQSFRPWQLACWPNWLIPDPNEDTVSRVVALSYSLEDPADKCVVCCRGNYFTGRRRDVLLSWWQQNKGEKSTGDFPALLALSYAYEA